MGCRIHIHTVHKIEYGAEGFNWQITELEKLLTDCGCSIYSSLNDDCVGDWEIEEQEFIGALEKIKYMSPEKLASYFSSDFVNESLDDFKKEVETLLITFAETGAHESGYYHFSWF